MCADLERNQVVPLNGPISNAEIKIISYPRVLRTVP